MKKYCCLIYLTPSVIIKKAMFYPISAETWPQVFDDSVARRDWGWRHELGVEELADIMIDGLRPVYAKEREEREKREAN